MTGKKNNPRAARASDLAGELRALMSQLKRRLREQVHLGDYTWSQASVLLRLERDGPATVTALARAEGVRQQSMGATISALQRAGLVKGSPDPADGRRNILSLTASFRKMIKAHRAAKEDWLLRAIQSNLSSAEQEKLAAGLKLLKRIADS